MNVERKLTCTRMFIHNKFMYKISYISVGINNINEDLHITIKKIVLNQISIEYKV